MPKIAETFATYKEEKDKDIDYPVMEVTLGFGFILIFLLEKGLGAKNQKQPSARSRDSCQTNSLEMTVSEKTTQVSQQAVTDDLDLVKQNSTVQFVESNADGTVACECAKGYEMLARKPGVKEYAFAFALCLHALIEGVVVGFFDDAVYGSWG
jgi:zinc transporter ZupT